MKLKIEKVEYDTQIFIGIHIPYQDTLSRDKIKTIDGRLWHPQEKFWLVPYNTTTYQTLKITFINGLEIVPSDKARMINPPLLPPKMEVKDEYKKENKHDFKPIENNSLFDQLNDKQKLAVTKLEELLIEERKAYHTRKGYRNILIQFLFCHPNTVPSLITNAQIKAYILKRIKEENISKSTQNHLVSTFKAFYGRLLGQTDKVENLYRPENEQHLPKMLTPEEIIKLMKQVGNIKHKCILSLLYGSGLRVGEVVRLKHKDLDFEEKIVFVDNGKHYKDRYSVLSVKSIAYLKQYFEQHKPTPTVWLFESPDGGHYSERSVQQFFADAMSRAQIKKQVSTHSLRHAFATGLLKSSSDLDFVKKVMGHASIKTTEIYLHVLKSDISNNRSPLDDLDL
jgi:integrase/recombinase XerD